jgi:ketosteroid isomerase-like protein
MYKAAVRWMVRRNTRALRLGNPGPLLAGYDSDAVLVFPGTSSWAGEHRGKPAIEAFLKRFLAAGLVGDVQEILVNGPPWRTKICVLFADMARDDSGNVVYENRVALFGCIEWGKIVYQEDYLDTIKVEEFDRYLGRSATAS